MKNKLLWTAIFCLALSGAVYAAEQPKGSSRPPNDAQPPDMEKMQEDMVKIRQHLDKQQQENMDRMKDLDPKGYESQKKTMGRQAQISQIMSAYQQKSISADDAERKLTPLIKQEIQEQNAGLDEQIKTAEKKLASLKQAKSNSNAMVKKRIDQMLGRSGPPGPNDMI